MITILFHVRTLEDTVEAFRAFAEKATPLSRAEDGCLGYVFHQQKDDPRNFVLREQWRDKQALKTHIDHLIEVFGPPRPGEALPAAMTDLCASTDLKFYTVIGE
ncbi:putative Antibiotic biosynthesis monooxygenase [Desulfosarcina cetonica]|uniref:putative quinol monooxygenase n=1 Tax=Desulfosarcina cetonica TaxID=90730 RepID=UPI0006D021D8|nr:putative quinol monooxygenase [Desulfosarcina cetonica]VTR65787.1 putative Antibiotic biosynthesis monooxygenase [Desulfosarcina cetonica]